MEVEKSGVQTMRQNTGKFDFFCIISTTLFYRKTLQVSFWKIRT